MRQGVGLPPDKTTTAHALATGLISKGYKVLVVDTDPQGNISYAMQANINGKGLYEAMREETTAAEIIQHTPQGDIIPSTLLLTAADLEFTQRGREYILNSVLEPVKEKYSHIVIDSPPTLGILTINALVACTDVIIPLTADIFALQGLSQLYRNIDRVKKFCNKNVHIAGLLLTRYSSR
jgi:chromosome partitioning protein